MYEILLAAPRRVRPTSGNPRYLPASTAGTGRPGSGFAVLVEKMQQERRNVLVLRGGGVRPYRAGPAVRRLVPVAFVASAGHSAATTASGMSFVLPPR